MITRRLSEIKALLASPEFKEWWDQLVSARTSLADAEMQREEMLAQQTLMEFRAELTQKNAIDTLYQAGEHEDAAARFLVESAELENRSFPGVAAFEAQRIKVSELWYRLGAAERALDLARAEKRTAEDLAVMQKKVTQQAEEYALENSRKNRMWDEVERLWDRSIQVGLLTSERRVQARKVRAAAEAQFALAETRKKQALALKQDAEFIAGAVETARTAVNLRREMAAGLFQCAPGTDFLYFRCKDEQHKAFAVALVEDRTSYNIEVKALTVYSLSAKTGVAFLEPASENTATAEESDRRFEKYFLTGRQGAVPVPNPSSP